MYTFLLRIFVVYLHGQRGSTPSCHPIGASGTHLVLMCVHIRVHHQIYSHIWTTYIQSFPSLAHLRLLSELVVCCQVFPQLKYWQDSVSVGHIPKANRSLTSHMLQITWNYTQACSRVVTIWFWEQNDSDLTQKFKSGLFRLPWFA
jgi:hypothetical protein